MGLDIIILAAGQGTRMKSSLPKVLHHIAGKPMIRRVIDTAKMLNNAQIHVVVGHGEEKIRSIIQDSDINWIQQDRPLGTGHAVQQVLPYLKSDSNVVVLYGDVPLVNYESLKQLLDILNRDDLAILTVNMETPKGYGRIIRNIDGQVVGIVEEKDASFDQLQIKEVNTGIIAAPSVHLSRWLPLLNNENVQNEFYLTDIVKMANDEKLKIHAVNVLVKEEVFGVNDRLQQASLERYFQIKQAEALMQLGVTIVDPQRFDCRGDIKVGSDVTFDINVVLEGSVIIGNDVVIEPNCIVKNSNIGNGSRIKANSIVDGSYIHENVEVGPFARLRPGTIIGSHSRIGNFVETKNAVFGCNTKANHLSYIGDAEIGQSCNIGAGTITCNYDGENKHKTIINDRVFVGSNTTLVAPIVVQSDGFIGAGSTITKAVPSGCLAVGRGQQRNIEGWKRPSKK